MQREPYIDYNRDDMILRDVLALHRTKLANERTFLAYGRTAFAAFAGGVTLIRLFESIILNWLGYFLLLVSGGLIIYGIYSYLRTRANFQDLDREVPQNLEKRTS